MIKPFPTLDPDDKLTHWMDGSDFAAEEGSAVDTITVAIVDNPDGALALTNVAQSGSVLSFMPVGATEGVTYTLRGRCLLANGEQEDESRTITGEQH